MLVVDASVAVKWFLVEPGDREALALLDGDEPLIAPELVVAEVVNAVWKRLVSGGIDAS
jgi:predicted nucleic acid-binding protein